MNEPEEETGCLAPIFVIVVCIVFMYIFLNYASQLRDAQRRIDDD